ncbi:MAG TPA: Mut7-C RNAse domain-containing protein [bacterium]
MLSTTLLVTDECLRLTRWLRLLGYDAAAQAARPLEALYLRAVNENRTIVTRTRAVHGGELVRVVTLRAHTRTDQLAEVLRALGDAVEDSSAFSRCVRCNTGLEPAEKAAVRTRVPAYVYETQSAFTACAGCGRIYWSATHWQRARAVMADVAARLQSTPRHA